MHTYNATFRKLVDHEFKAILGYTVSFRLICAMRPGFKKSIHMHTYVSICMRIYVCACKYVYFNVWIYACTRAYIYVNISCKFICTQMHMYRCICTHVYMCMWIYMIVLSIDVPALCTIPGTHMHTYDVLSYHLPILMFSTSACPWWMLCVTNSTASNQFFHGQIPNYWIQRPYEDFTIWLTHVSVSAKLS